MCVNLIEFSVHLFTWKIEENKEKYHEHIRDSHSFGTSRTSWKIFSFILNGFFNKPTNRVTNSTIIYFSRSSQISGRIYNNFLLLYENTLNFRLDPISNQHRIYRLKSILLEINSPIIRTRFGSCGALYLILRQQEMQQWW